MNLKRIIFILISKNIINICRNRSPITILFIELTLLYNKLN